MYIWIVIIRLSYILKPAQIMIRRLCLPTVCSLAGFLLILQDQSSLEINSCQKFQSSASMSSKLTQ